MPEAAQEREGQVRYISGDIAVAEGAIAAGCRFFAGYPITPSTEVAEHMARSLPMVGGTYIQMEDELASMAAILGASWGGLKSMTATSGPGFSLMMENIGLGIMLETPCVIVDVQRGGPSTGLPTLVGQGDVMQAKWGSHGSYEIIALCPNSPQECFELAIKAFNLSEAYRVPVIVLTDECIGHMFERVVIPPRDEIEIVDRSRVKPGVVEAPKGDGLVFPMPIAGEGIRFHVTSLTHDERGYPATDPENQEKLVRRLCDKIRRNADKMTDLREVMMEDAEIAVVAYGAPSRTALKSLRLARDKGVKVGMIRLRTIWPFPERHIAQVAQRVRAFIVPEINYGQLVFEVERCAAGKARAYLVEKMGGTVHRPEEILEKILEVAGA